MKGNVRISVHELNLKRKWVMQQDNKEAVIVLKRPSQSPGLNPIEKRVRKTTNMPELKLFFGL